jgi:hypothetical protein
MNKTRVLIQSTSPHGEWEYSVGDKGTVDGYCRGGDGVPYAVVIKDRDNRFAMVPLTALVCLNN